VCHCTSLHSGDPPHPCFLLARFSPWLRTHRSGIFGAQLRQLVSGDVRSILWSNFMIDLPWAMSAMPSMLKAVQQGGLVIAHGESQEEYGPKLPLTVGLN